MSVYSGFTNDVTAILDARYLGGASGPASAVKTASFSALPGMFFPIDTTSGAVTVTLPTNPVDQTIIELELVAGTITNGVAANAVTYNAGAGDHFNLTTGATSLTLTKLRQGARLGYDLASRVWRVEHFVDPSQEEAYLSTVYGGAGNSVAGVGPYVGTAPARPSGTFAFVIWNGDTDPGSNAVNGDLGIGW
jgi:hypothetical protein